MLEYTVNAATRDAMARAHAERGLILRRAWNWLVRRRPAPGETALAAVH